MSVLDAGKWMCLLAIAEATGAACVIPGAWPTVAAIGLAYSDPGQIDHAGDDWRATAAQMNTVKQQLEQLSDGVPPEKWQEGGREAFDTALGKFKDELDKVSSFTDDVGSMLKIAGIAFFAFAVLALAIASLLALWALSILATSWTIVGAAALEAAGNAVAGICDTIISTACVSLKTALMVIGGIIGAGMVVYSLAPGMATNPTGSGPVNFQQATIMPTAPGTPNPPTA